MFIVLNRKGACHAATTYSYCTFHPVGQHTLRVVLNVCAVHVYHQIRLLAAIACAIQPAMMQASHPLTCVNTGAAYQQLPQLLRCHGVLPQPA